MSRILKVKSLVSSNKTPSINSIKKDMVKECIVELKTLNKSHNLFLPFLLLIISIPLPVFINNILLLLVTVNIFTRINKAQINYNSSLVFLILFFLLCSLSLSWSIDYKSSLNTLPRLISMILLPSLFMVYQPFEPHHKIHRTIH